MTPNAVSWPNSNTIPTTVTSWTTSSTRCGSSSFSSWPNKPSSRAESVQESWIWADPSWTPRTGSPANTASSTLCCCLSSPSSCPPSWSTSTVCCRIEQWLRISTTCTTVCEISTITSSKSKRFYGKAMQGRPSSTTSPINTSLSKTWLKRTWTTSYSHTLILNLVDQVYRTGLTLWSLSDLWDCLKGNWPPFWRIWSNIASAMRVT